MNQNINVPDGIHCCRIDGETPHPRITSHAQSKRGLPNTQQPAPTSVLNINLAKCRPIAGGDAHSRSSSSAPSCQGGRVDAVPPKKTHG